MNKPDIMPAKKIRAAIKRAKKNAVKPVMVNGKPSYLLPMRNFELFNKMLKKGLIFPVGIINGMMVWDIKIKKRRTHVG